MNKGKGEGARKGKNRSEACAQTVTNSVGGILIRLTCLELMKIGEINCGQISFFTILWPKNEKVFKESAFGCCQLFWQVGTRIRFRSLVPLDSREQVLCLYV